MDLHYFILLLIKHAIVDVGIQRHLGWMGKEKYFSKLAQQHYVGHGLGTFLALFLGGLGLVPSIIAAIFDWWCHWQIDHTKARINNRYEIASSSNTFWWLLTVDQILHYLTYLVIVLFLV